MSLVSVATKLGKKHSKLKDAEVALKGERTKFFDEVTKEVAKGTLAQKVVEYPQVQDLMVWIDTYHPGWNLLGEDAEQGTLLLQEDPTKTKFIFVNHKDGMVYQRNAIQGAPSLDDEALAEDHPEIWKRISAPAEPPWREEIYKFVQWFGEPTDNDIAAEYINERVSGPDWPRELRPLEELDHQDLETLADYMVPGSISLRLEAPRKAKLDELNEDDQRS